MKTCSQHIIVCVDVPSMTHTSVIGSVEDNSHLKIHIIDQPLGKQDCSKPQKGPNFFVNNQKATLVIFNALGLKDHTASSIFCSKTNSEGKEKTWKQMDRHSIRYANDVPLLTVSVTIATNDKEKKKMCADKFNVIGGPILRARQHTQSTTIWWEERELASKVSIHQPFLLYLKNLAAADTWKEQSSLNEGVFRMGF